MSGRTIKRCVLLALFIVTTAGACLPQLNAAQKSSAIEELFTWFPIGDYRAFTYVDLAGLERAETYIVFDTYFKASDLLFDDRLIPPHLKGQYNVKIGAAIAQARYKKGESWVDFAKKSYEEQKELAKKGEIPKPVENDDYLVVWQFDDLDSLIKEALKNGEIDTTEEVILDRQVYAFSTPPMSGMRYAYATLTQEFLTASKPENLRAMIAAGMGLELNLLDNEANLDLIDLIPHLGQFWTITNHYYQFRNPSRFYGVAVLPKSILS
jgi:hypothetical protein